MKQLIVFIIALCSCITLFAQQINYSYTNYNILQSLPDNKVQSFLQDSRGFLWIGTSEGLSRFDGNHFKNFYTKKGDTILLSNFFTNIFEYRKGHLLMNNGNQVVCLNTYNQKFYFPDLPIRQLGPGLLSRPVHGKGFYLSTTNKAHILSDDLKVQHSIDQPKTKGKDALLSIYFLTDTMLLLQHANNFYLYDTVTKKTEQLQIDFKFKDNTYIPYFRYYDVESQLLYFTEYQSGLFTYSLKTKLLEHKKKASNGTAFTNGFIYQVLPRSKNELWFLTNQGIHIYQKNSNTVSILKAGDNNIAGLISNTVFTGYIDKDENIWLGTINGISKININGLGIKNWSNNFTGLYGSGLMSIKKGADSNIYISEYNSKTYQLNTKTNFIRALEHPLNYGSWNLFPKGNEIIRTGLGNTLLSYNTVTGKYKVLDFLKPFYPNIEIIVLGFITKKGDEWYSANKNGGFVRVIGLSGKVVTYKKEDPNNGFSNTYYTSYTETEEGDLWFGVNKSNKLLHWYYKEERFEEIDFSKKGTNKYSFNTGINFLTHDSNNNIWVAFDGSGLVRYNPFNKEILHFTIAEGLPSSFLFGMEFDNKNRLWISTAKGLSCFIEKENRFVNFNKENGLPDDNFTDYCNFFDRSKNELWFGTTTTLMAFNPDRMIENRNELIPVYIDEIVVNGQKIQDTVFQNLALKSTQNNLQFLFAGVDLNNGQDIEYSYQLKGADKDWVFIGNNQSATYANLSPGKYAFKVRARHRGDNQWHEIKEPLVFFIATPWNRTWWFYSILFLGIGLLIWYFIRSYYQRKIEKQQSVIEKQKAVEEERNRIAADMHDDLGSGLTKITYLSQMALHKESNKEDLTNIQRTSTALVENMSEIIWAMKEENNSLEDLLYYIKRYAMEYCTDNNLNCTIHLPEKLYPRIVAGQNRRNIFLAIKEILHNVVKHARAKNISIKVTYDTSWHVEIKDDGVGLPPEGIATLGNGIKNIKRRIAAVRGKVNFETANGTIVHITIPL